MSQRVPTPANEYVTTSEHSADETGQRLWRPLLVRGLGLVVGMVTLTFVGLLGNERPHSDGQPMAASLGQDTWLAAARSVTPDQTERPPASTERETSAAAANRAPPEPVLAAATSAQAGDPPPPATSPSAQPGPSQPQGSGITKDGKVILNAANASELTRLPGVGKKRAEQIVALRAKLKRFKQPSDLLRIKGIGVRTLRKMLPHLVVDAVVDAAPEAAEAGG